MTPQEALAQALHRINGGGPGQPPTNDAIEGVWSEMGMAAAILDALPEGWKLLDIPPTFGKYTLAQRAIGAQQERERLRAVLKPWEELREYDFTLFYKDRRVNVWLDGLAPFSVHRRADDLAAAITAALEATR